MEGQEGLVVCNIIISCASQSSQLRSDVWAWALGLGLLSALDVEMSKSAEHFGIIVQIGLVHLQAKCQAITGEPCCSYEVL